MAFSWIYSISLIVWFLCWHQTCIAYLKIESKIAKCTILKRYVLIKYLTFARRLQLLLNLLFIGSSWKVHVRSLSKESSRYLVCFAIFIFCLLFPKLWCFVIVLVSGWKRIISDLLAFSEILFAHNYWTVWERSMYFFTFLSDLCDNMLVSSAKWWVKEWDTASFRSLIHIRNSKRSSTVCGNSWVASILSETIACWIQFVLGMIQINWVLLLLRHSGGIYWKSRKIPQESSLYEVLSSELTISKN